MPRLGVIADTHITSARAVLPAAMLEGLSGVDAILHAGDLVDRSVLAALERIAPVHAVYGNCDPPALAAELPGRRVVAVGSARLGLTHGHLGSGPDTPRRARAYCASFGQLHAIVFGHSHQPYNAVLDGVLLFNPGSPTQRRRQPYPSYGLLEIEGEQVHGRIIEIR